jgi:hypothetical protein
VSSHFCPAMLAPTTHRDSTSVGFVRQKMIVFAMAPSRIRVVAAEVSPCALTLLRRYLGPGLQSPRASLLGSGAGAVATTSCGAMAETNPIGLT